MQSSGFDYDNVLTDLEKNLDLFIQGNTKVFITPDMGDYTRLGGKDGQFDFEGSLELQIKSYIKEIAKKKEIKNKSLLSNVVERHFVVIKLKDKAPWFEREFYTINVERKEEVVTKVIANAMDKKNGSLDSLVEDPFLQKIIAKQFSYQQVLHLVSDEVQALINNPYTAKNLSVALYSDIIDNFRTEFSKTEGERIIDSTIKDSGTSYQFYTIADKPAYYPREGKNFPGIPKSAVEGEIKDADGVLDSKFRLLDVYFGQSRSYPDGYTIKIPFIGEIQYFDKARPNEEQRIMGTYPQWYNTNEPGFLKILEKDSSFSGLDITKYKFKYLNASNINSGFWKKLSLAIFGESLVEWWTGEQQDPNGKINDIMLASYGEFIARVLSDAASDGDLDSSLSRHYEAVFKQPIVAGGPSRIGAMFEFVLSDKEAARRVEKFRYLANLAESNPEKYLKVQGDQDSFFTDEDEKNALIASADAFLDNNGTPQPSVGKNGTEEKNIEGRARFFKQCALILNLEKINKAFEAHINLDLPRQSEKGSPFNGRFHMLKHNLSQELIISNLISPIDGREFFEIPPHVLSTLTPKLRLFRVENKKNNGQLLETEFIFPQRTDIDRVKDYKRPQPDNLQIPDNFLSARFDKGEGCGLKEFSFEFNGTNPAESRNDIKATMKLYFQTFADFIRKRKSKNGKEYSFVDLIVQPVNEATNDMVNQIKLIHPNQYDPSFYRIRAEIGYNYPDNLDSFYDRSTELRNAIDLTNKSFYLCMVDHELNIDLDGTVEITISYRAYAETALKSLRYDALSTPELVAAREKALASYKKALESNDCNTL